AATDNLAWIWVEETALTRPDGTVIPNHWVGLRRTNRLIRDSFSNAFRQYLQSLDPWFTQMEAFRHALAHRIPLYIPPYVVTRANAAAYNDLEDRKTQASLQLD